MVVRMDLPLHHPQTVLRRADQVKAPSLQNTESQYTAFAPGMQLYVDWLQAMLKDLYRLRREAVADERVGYRRRWTS
jgi:hypothetical protein